MTKDEFKLRIIQIRDFYLQLSIYGVITFLLFFMWIFMKEDGGFWPIWPTLFWGIYHLYRAFQLSLMPASFQDYINPWLEKLPFLKESWIDKQVEEFTKESSLQKTPLAKKTASRKKNPPKSL